MSQVYSKNAMFLYVSSLCSYARYFTIGYTIYNLVIQLQTHCIRNW